jgi:hypothetical protein
LPPFAFLAFIFQSKYSLRVHFLVAEGAVFVDYPKDKSEGEEEIDGE